MRPYDVIVVGAGMAGLSAAHRLARAGLRVSVVEAQARLGGRISTLHSPGHPPMELGAEFVHGRPPTLLSVLHRAKLRLGRADGPHLIHFNRQLRAAPTAMERTMEVLGSTGPSDEPVGELIRRSLRSEPFAKALALAYVEGFYAADSNTASALAIARMERSSSGDLHRVLSGYDGVVERLAKELAALGVAVASSSPVEEIRWRPRQVRVATRALFGAPGLRLQGRTALVTVPLSVLQARGREAIRFSPPLPEKKRQWAALQMGTVIKVVLRFRSSVPWRRRSFTFLHAPRLPFPTFWRMAPFDVETLVAWSAGPKAVGLDRLADQQIAQLALSSLGRILHVSTSELEQHLDGAHVANWSKAPFVRGAYSVIPTGATHAQEKLAAPVEETLFFAGEATEPDFAGTVQGALISGQREANRIMASMGPDAARTA